jgi:hypothetical protein
MTPPGRSTPRSRARATVLLAVVARNMSRVEILSPSAGNRQRPADEMARRVGDRRASPPLRYALTLPSQYHQELSARIDGPEAAAGQLIRRAFSASARACRPMALRPTSKPTIKACAGSHGFGTGGFTTGFRTTAGAAPHPLPEPRTAGQPPPALAA